MRRPARILLVTLAVCLPLAGPSLGRAAEGLYLTWNDCALGDGAAADLASVCASDLGDQVLFCAFGLSAPVDSVLGVELVVDLQSAASQVPDWWRFEPGGCRAGNLTAGFTFPPSSPCADFLHGNAAGGVQEYSLHEPRGGASQARIQVAASVLPSVGGYASLDPGPMYYAARLVIANARTGACPGCSQPACLVLNSIVLRRQPGAAGGDQFLSAPGPGLANRATWQGGLGADCSAVPALAMTWGRIKGMYR